MTTTRLHLAWRSARARAARNARSADRLLDIANLHVVNLGRAEADRDRLARELAATNVLLAAAREGAAQRTVERDSARASHQLQQQNTARFHAQAQAAYAFADEMGDYCSPHGVAAMYADRLRQRLDQAQPNRATDRARHDN